MEETVMEAIVKMSSSRSSSTSGREEEAGLMTSWAMEVGKSMVSLGFNLPSPELAQLLVSNLCFRNNHPSLWKFLQFSLSSRLLSPLHVLSLLSARVIPHRHSQPQAFRLFLQLLAQYAFSLDPLGDHSVIKSVDATLQLSRTYGIRVLEPGHVLVLFFFSIVTGLVDIICCDWGLTPDMPLGPFQSADHHPMEIDNLGDSNTGRTQHRDLLRESNTCTAMEVLTKLTETRKAMLLLHAVHLNLPERFSDLLQRLLLVKANRLASSNMKCENQLLERLFTNIERVCGFQYQLNKHQLVQMLIDVEPCNPSYGQFGCWVPFDIYMENAMDGRQFPVRSGAAILAETIKTLQVLNRASWKETFLTLWLAALRLVQRERDPLEGPIPHLESRLTILLTIVPLAIASVLEDDAKPHSSSSQGGRCKPGENVCKHQVDRKGQASKKLGLVSSLQVLGQFHGLLCPPMSVIDAANVAVAKAAIFVSNANNGKDGVGNSSYSDISVNAGGDMRHLIVEACIARNLIDTSSYFWPGYVSASVISQLDSAPVRKSPWLTFMEGAPLNNSLVNSLLMTPAPCLAGIEKLNHFALNGSPEEKSAAAKILCGSSLSCGWNIQEHVVHHVVKLLSPPIPSTHSGKRSHLIDYMNMLSAILVGASSIDTVHILSLHGVIPEVAAALMPLCEEFGSLMPTSINRSIACDEPSVYMVFSSAFLFLLRLWKFYRPAIEQCLTGGAVGAELTLEYLLLLRNNRMPLDSSVSHDEINRNSVLEHLADKPVYLDFYPNLRAWYCQNKSCVASPLSGLSTGSPVHQVANKILNMIYWKMSKGAASSGSSSSVSNSSVCGSSPNAAEDSSHRPILPAWEILEAIPLVLEAILTACAHGRLSSRDLTTGLRDLIDFLPASIGTIISYFSAEITRGMWKPVQMNGTDWPSPSPILSTIEAEMKEILVAAGVDFPSCSSGLSPLMLPLPMAALVSLTITFKLSRSLEYIHAVVGLALENCASGCSWPSIHIVGSLWAQKVRRWHHFIVVSCARSIFRRNKVALSQLLRSCFSSFLGSINVSSSLLTNHSSVSGLLGNIIATPGVHPSIAPGFLYLRSCRTIHDVQHLNNVIIGLVAEYAREAGMRWGITGSARLKSSQASLSFAAAKAREVAVLGASLICVAGGINLVQELYRETVPTWLLSSREEKLDKVSAVSLVVEGYSVAYMLVLSGSLIWGIESTSPPWALSRRACIVGAHMDFLARVMEGKISLGCHPSTWKAYVSCLVGLVVSFAPALIQEVKLDTLKSLANGLRGWHECELALSLLERGGIEALGSVAELVNLID
ncbi:hypothetical protein K2173_008148 [Erythroxylum novogranatense]|uniref:Mediator of RNA polymerase II transcription subunit 33A n=1 Tax=Erythroxylum novogranatense TaxID=1862640 RepID=A0AAV8U9W7_9ROSI|nr:hypothetical protein K2173_008148 [Erythroxylum novogranatense]